MTPDRVRIRPFRVGVPDLELEILRTRIMSSRWPDQIPGTGWQYGTDSAYLAELCRYWATGFEWRKTEARLNEWPQFSAVIDGQRIHFIHARSPHEGAMPLLLTHGWPGSVLDFMKVLGPLTEPTAYGGHREDSFHVICPSLPGFGWSGPTSEAGWDLRRASGALGELMANLGYERFGAQGGDWGAGVTRLLARAIPSRLTGIHLTTVVVPPVSADGPMAGVTEEEIRALERVDRIRSGEMAYRDIQSTRPQTLAYALADSPVGLAAWIVEKFRNWSDCSGEVESRFTREELLGNITAYWVTGTIGSSMRLYFETRQTDPAARDQWREEDRVEVPTGCAIFPADIHQPPRVWAERWFNVKRWTVMPSGGHFPALEEPDLFVEEVRSFFRPLRLDGREAARASKTVR